MTAIRRSTGPAPMPGVATLARHGKLREPQLPDHYVRRRRLFALLDEVTTAPFTLVVAPAGAGKTSLLAGWTAEATGITAWLSLDEADRDAGQFWADFIAVIASVVPGFGASAAARLRRLARRAEIVDELLEGLAIESPPVFVVIDDLHLVDDVVGPSLAVLAQHLPSWLHLIGLTRRDPTMPLERLRARSQLGEVRFTELRFSHDEATGLLGLLAPSLPPDRVEAMVVQAEGWAASLQLAALAERSMKAQEGLDTPLAAGDVLVHEYVWHEVMAAEDADVIDVLQATAIVERVNASLAVAVSGRDDAGELLLRAKARGLFVTRIDADGWFEVHSLVRSVLVRDLRERAPERLAELHRRAAHWYQDAGDVPAALDHWLLADQPREALRLVAAKGAALYDSGREATIVRTTQAIPPHVAGDDIDAMIEFAWCHLLVDRHRFQELVEQLSWWATRSSLDVVHEARVTMLRSMAATMSGRWDDGGALARQAMTALGDAAWRDPICRFGWNMVARQVALSEQWEDLQDDVREAELALGRDAERRLAFEGTRALGEALAGRPLDALRVVAGVRQAAAVSQMTILNAELAAAEAIACRELGDRPRALAGLEALAASPAEAMLYCQVLGGLELTQARLDEGDLEAAQAAFDAAEVLVDLELTGTGPRSWLARTGTMLALAADNVARADDWAGQVDDPFWGGVSRARVRLAEGQRAAARSALDEVRPRCVRHEVVLCLLRARAIDDNEEAMKLASRAVELAAADGLLQTVASEGPEATELAERAAWRAPEQWVDRLRRAAAERHRGPYRRVELVEQLTERERDVLRFLPSRLTVHEIADELYVSVNTLKFHLKVIYRKLGVSSRAEAAEVARKLTLGPPN